MATPPDYKARLERIRAAEREKEARTRFIELAGIAWDAMEEARTASIKTSTPKV